MVYFIKNENYVKIGFTNNPIKRFNQIKTSVPSDLYFLLIIDGDRKLEKELHYLFSKYRYRGEWFIYNDEIINYIDSKMDDDLRYKYGIIESVKNELMPIRRHRINCGLTLKDLGNLLHITKGGAQQLEKRAAIGSISLNKMREVAEVTGHNFEFRFIKKK